MKTKLLLGLFLLASLQFTSAQSAGFTGAFNNWNGAFVTMSTTDNVNYTISSYYIPTGEFKFRIDGDWLGGSGFPTGTAATSNGANINATATDFYDIAFNITTGAYSFSSATSSDQQISIIGDFNSWGADLALATTDNINYSVNNATLTGAAFKFRRNANWSAAYGGTGGTASASGGNIPVPADGTYDITFNIQTLAYTISTSTLAVDDFTKNIQFYYSKNALNINGYTGKISISAFDILGRLLYSKEDIQVQNGFSKNIDLPKGQLSLFVIEGAEFTKRLKVIAQ